jgi:hypothetical protein
MAKVLSWNHDPAPRIRTDPEKDTAIFVRELKMTTKKLVWSVRAYFFLKVHLHHSSSTIKCQSHKHLKIKVLIFAWWKDLGPYLGTADQGMPKIFNREILVKKWKRKMFTVKTTKRSKLYIKERSATFLSSRPVPVTFTTNYFSRSKYKFNESWFDKKKPGNEKKWIYTLDALRTALTHS